MNFYRFWQRRNKKDSFDKELLNADLFSQLTHLTGTATAGLTRAEIFEQASRLPYYSSVYFKKVHFLAQDLNYDYSDSCRIVGEETEEVVPKEFLLRLSSALIAGEDEVIFFAREAYVIGEIYGDEYVRQVESLTKWSDAYMVLIISAATVITITILSTIIYPMNPFAVVALNGLALLAVVAGAWILHRAAPKEVKTHSLPYSSREQVQAKVMFKSFLPITGITCLLLALLGIDLGWAMIVAGVLILPPGFVIMRDDKKIDKYDTDIGTFLRSLGGVTKAIGSTVTESLSRLNFRALGSLQSGVNHLHVRLYMGIKSDLCWTRFVSETGSELVNRSTQIFWDSVKVGGDPREVGKAASSYALKISLLRGKRKQVSNSFTWLCIIMHAVVASLMVLVYQIMLTFSTAFQSLQAEGSATQLGNMPFKELFSGVHLNLLHIMMILMIVVLTGANAFAIKAVDGGHNLKIIFYLSIMLATSGAVLMLVPQIASGLFPDFAMAD